ncbi:hypothetical protein RIR_jg36550.t1 [Rhizophagus irregularis DAOM 181602=DAOM 197198]|nr:hypothetical protein RIR_jg36550.t1 [Rhizophagus irregularis DAOM 181602=DAOM 197198]
MINIDKKSIHLSIWSFIRTDNLDLELKRIMSPNDHNFDSFIRTECHNLELKRQCLRMVTNSTTDNPECQNLELKRKLIKKDNVSE